MANRLLRNADYIRATEENEDNNDLDQLIGGKQQILVDTEQVAQAEMISYLKQRYITANVFSNTSAFSITATYKAKNLVEYTASDWAAETSYTGYALWVAGTYAINTIKTYNGYLYTSLSNGNTATPTDPVYWTKGAASSRVVEDGKIYEAIANSEGMVPSENTDKWVYVCDDKSLFYLTLPENEWSFETEYEIGDEVWYNDSVYTALVANENIKPSSSTSVWGAGVAYSKSGYFPTDTTYWTAGDNRNQQIVLYLMCITLYWLHYRVNPRFIPDKIKEAYDGNGPTQSGGAIGWLKRVADGRVNADLEEIVPIIGLAIQGGNANDTDALRTKRDNQMW